MNIRSLTLGVFESRKSCCPHSCPTSQDRSHDLTDGQCIFSRGTIRIAFSSICLNLFKSIAEVRNTDGCRLTLVEDIDLFLLVRRWSRRKIEGPLTVPTH
jgi:hypothetical protein